MEELLVTLLASSPPLVSLVNQRIQWGTREQASGLPAVSLAKVSGGPVYSDEGEAGLTETRVQIDCWASTFGTATAVARAVQAQLSGHFDGFFRYISLDVSRDLSEGGGNQAEYQHRTSMDFIILHGSI